MRKDGKETAEGTQSEEGGVWRRERQKEGLKRQKAREPQKLYSNALYADLKNKNKKQNK